MTEPSAATSPYLARLLAAMRKATSEDEQLAARAEYAGALARYGNFDSAQGEIGILRKANARYTPSVTAWILIAEGQLLHFRALAPDALSCFRRAHAIASSAQRMDIACVARAWMSASEYVGGDVLVAAADAAEALRQATPGSVACYSRAHLVIADSLACAGIYDLASKHYGLARRFASEAGDISMQSVVLFNAAAFGVAGLTIQDCLGGVLASDLRSVELQLLSIAHLDAGIGVSSLTALVPLLQAEWLTAARRWSDAIDRYEGALRSADQQGQERWLAKYFAEIAYCSAQLNRNDRAREAADTALARLPECTDADNRAVAHKRLAQAFERLGEFGRVQRHESEAAAEFRAHHDHQQHLSAKLREVVSILNPPA